MSAYANTQFNRLNLDEVDDATLARELERMALSYLMVTPDAKSVRADVHA